MMSPTGRSRIVQIHPTRACNLRCRHCYSSSGPEERGQLPPALLRTLLADAAIEGYDVAGFSGGEPLLYRPLPELLEYAHDLGMRTTVTTNGMLLDERRLEALAGRVDVLAISLDGTPESHVRMRGDVRAFSTLESRLDGVRASRIPFGFIFTLTMHNLHELDWVADFAVAQGASLLQIHPLEVTGRAVSTLPNARPDGREGAYAYVLARALEERLDGRIKVQLDLASRETIAERPACVFAEGPTSCAATIGQPLSDLVSPLVVEADGTVVPLEYGISRSLALGSLFEDRLPRLAERWRRETLPTFRHVCRSAYQGVIEREDVPLANWYEAVREASVALAPGAPAAPVTHVEHAASVAA